MRHMKWVGVTAAGLLIVSCFMVWVTIPSKSLTVTGVEAVGTSFGRPGYLHLLLILFYIPFSLIPRIWAKRTNLAVTALNMAWAIRNYYFITACRSGDCPEKHTGIYLVMLACFVMLVAALFPDIKMAPELKTPGQE